MINIKTKLLNDKGTDISRSIQISGANAFTEQLAIYLKEQLKNRRCENHPNQTSTILVVSNIEKSLKPLIHKSFCCKMFDELIEIKVK